MSGFGFYDRKNAVGDLWLSILLASNTRLPRRLQRRIRQRIFTWNCTINLRLDLIYVGSVLTGGNKLRLESSDDRNTSRRTCSPKNKIDFVDTLQLKKRPHWFSSRTI